MAKANRLLSIVNKTERFPDAARYFLLSKLFGRVVPFVGTSAIRYELITPQKVICSIANQKRVQNHIQGVHAAAMALLAETATGFVMGVNTPDDKLLLIKSMQLNYQKICQGDLQATAELTLEHREQILAQEKGEIDVPVQLIDESGQAPVTAQMVWAWLPKKKKS